MAETHAPRAAAIRPEPRRGDGHWPAAATPDAAAPGDRLLRDPDDIAAEADEAPMEVDAPTLPLGQPGNVRALSGEAPRDAGTAPATGAEATRPPAAAMLRAMDALRARDNKSELRVVYTRLTTLRQRLAERNRPASG